MDKKTTNKTTRKTKGNTNGPIQMTIADYNFIMQWYGSGLNKIEEILRNKKLWGNNPIDKMGKIKLRKAVEKMNDIWFRAYEDYKASERKMENERP